MDRPKHLIWIVIWLCIVGLLMAAFATLISYVRAFTMQAGGALPSQADTHHALPEYGVGIYASALLQIFLGLWALYIAGRITVADSRAIRQTTIWCWTQFALLGLFAALGISQGMLLSLQFDGDLDLDQLWVRAWAFGCGFADGAPCCGVGPFIVARYLYRAIKREETKAWFAAAQNAGLEKTDV